MSQVEHLGTELVHGDRCGAAHTVAAGGDEGAFALERDLHVVTPGLILRGGRMVGLD